MSRKREVNPWAIVLAADATGLGAVRALHRAGVRTIAVAANPAEPVLWSRYPVKRVVPGDGDPEAELLGVLRELPEGSALIPTSDQFVGFIARHREVLAGRFRCVAPSNPLVALFNDKAVETRRVAELGIPHPRTEQELPDDPATLAERLGLPLILKPRTADDGRRLGMKTAPIFDLPGLRAFYEGRRDELSRLIAQELVPGGPGSEWVCDCVFDRDHRLVSAFTFRKLTTSPPEFGVTCHGRVERNDELVRAAGRIAADLGYTGPADLDFKYDRRTGRHLYLELNPRVGMCGVLGVAGGVNCVADAYRVACGLPGAGSQAGPKDGAEYFNAYEELYGSYVAGGRSMKALLRSLGASAWILLRAPVSPYFSLVDPLPGVVVGWRRLGKFAARRRSSAGRLWGRLRGGGADRILGRSG